MAKTKKNIAKKKKKQTKISVKPAVNQAAVVVEKLTETPSIKDLKKEDKEYQRKLKEKQKKENPGFIKKTMTFLKSFVAELKKVQWLNKTELLKASASVFGISFAFTLSMYVFDTILGAIANLVL